MKPDNNYLSEKMALPVGCMCGSGSFEERLSDAYTSALQRLERADAPPELKMDLQWVLDLCASHVHEGKISPVAETLEINIWTTEESP